MDRSERELRLDELVSALHALSEAKLYDAETEQEERLNELTMALAEALMAYVLGDR